MRDLVGELFEVKRQANTDTTAPYLAALSLVRLGLVTPDAAEEAYPDAVGLADGFARFRATLAERGQVDFDEQIYRAIEILARRPGGPGRGAGPVPADAGRRVPGPDARRTCC